MGCCLGKSNQDAQITFIPEVETFLKSIQSQAQWSSVEVDGLRSILNPLAQEKTFPRVSSKILKRSEKEVDFNPEDGRDKHEFSISCYDVSCLLAQALLGLDKPTRQSGRVLDMIQLYRDLASRDMASREKLRSLWHYFERVSGRASDKSRHISVVQREMSKATLEKISDSLWTSKTPIGSLTCLNQRVEDADPQYMQTIPISSSMGDKFFVHGQDEVDLRICLFPELLAVVKWGVPLLDGQCLFIKGVERFSFHVGDTRSEFKLKPHYQDSLQAITERLQVTLVAKDYSCQPEAQFEMAEVLHEITNAYVSFMLHPWEDEKSPDTVATTHWGCESLRGDQELKAIAQLIAATENNRPLLFCTLNEPSFLQKFEEVHYLMLQTKLTTKALCKLLYKFCNYNHDQDKRNKLFDFLIQELMQMRA